MRHSDSFSLGRCLSVWVLLFLVAFNLSAQQACYEASDFGITPQNEDNSPALQALVNSVNSWGGGLIRMGRGEYVFRSTIHWLSGVSLEGVSVQGTVLRMVGDTNWTLIMGESFGQGLFTPVESVRFAHFTVDGYDMHPKEYTTNAKAFNIRPLTDAVFEDLVLRGTPATSLGVDFLNRVLITNVRVIEGGRCWSEGKGGGSGIGIGMRGFPDENFIITNCICIGCGNNGIFIEDQARFGNGANGRAPMTEGKGQIITGNIVKGGRNHGISIQGGRHITVSNNVVYDNRGAGFYGNFYMSDVFVTGNQFLDNHWGIYISPASNVQGFDGVGEFRDITIQGNVLRRNEVPMLLDVPKGAVEVR